MICSRLLRHQAHDLLTSAEITAIKSLTPSIKELSLRVDPSSGASFKAFLSIFKRLEPLKYIKMASGFSFRAGNWVDFVIQEPRNGSATPRRALETM